MDASGPEGGLWSERPQEAVKKEILLEAGYVLRSCRKIIKNKQQQQKTLARVSRELWPRSLCESHQWPSGSFKN